MIQEEVETKDSITHAYDASGLLDGVEDHEPDVVDHITLIVRLVSRAPEDGGEDLVC